MEKLCLGLLLWITCFGLGQTDIEGTFYKCCEEGNQWAATSSNCDSLSGRSVFSDVPVGHEAACQIAREICCRGTVRDKLCEDGKATARRRELCTAIKDLAGADTYKDCCDGCRLGLTVSQMGVTCALETFSLGVPWDEAFHDCCTGRDGQQRHENEIPQTNSQGASAGIASTDPTHTAAACEAGFKYNTALKDCIDVDECSEGLNDCALDEQVCLNTYGGYQCLSKDGEECPAGYKREGEVCIDVDECAEQIDACESELQEECKNTVGGYLCEPICSAGYRFNNHLHDCTDIDECAEGLHDCDSISTCVNRPGKYECKSVHQCMHGFRYSEARRRCVDIDECSEGSHDCTPRLQVCVNRNGTYACRNKVICPRGYRADDASGTCVDIDECREHLHSCSVQETVCINTRGSYVCRKKSIAHRCPSGFAFSHLQKGCVDVDECAEDLHGCADNEMCVNGIGSFSCVPTSSRRTCPSGHRKNRTSGLCEDINECEEHSHTCLGHLECVNTEGGYVCEPRKDVSGRQAPGAKCTVGLRPDPRTGACRDIDECEEQHPCGQHEKCRNFYGGYKCSCEEGFTRDEERNVCRDINECQHGGHNCQIGFRCDNTPGSYTCVRISGCGTGYTVNAATGQCEDDDECALGLHNCGPGFVCRNTEGSFRCDRKTCPQGSRLEPNGTCVELNCGAGMTVGSNGECSDINECFLNRTLCSRYHRCVNTPGSYHCESLLTCSPGYEANEDGDGCLDIDECARGTHTCKADQTCENLPGNYVCECPAGYRMNVLRECEDVDECQRFRGKVCSFNSVCSNTPGSYTCDCKEGFKRGDDARSCVDVNECEETDHGCDHNCINVWGSYHCTCNKGYRLDAEQKKCIDLDECELWKGRGNLCIGVCVNEPGSYSCSCPKGYRLGLDKRTCDDIDECEQSDVCNGENEICLNTRGGYRCNVLDCPPGYFRDTDHKNRCKRQLRDCPLGDTSCVNEPVSYSYNYFTLVNNMKIPSSGQLDFFTMRGPRFSFSSVQFDLDVVEARATSSTDGGVEAATRDHFYLRRTAFNEAMLSLVRPLQGPQDIQLQLRMKIYQHGLYAGNAVAKIFIYVTEYEY